jgi:DNA-binding HxlR family transcriptional regulator
LDYILLAMYRYGEYCPLAKTTSVLGDYWTPLIIRELLHGRQHFNDLVRSLPDISRSLLASRLRSMERGGVIHRLTGMGRNNTSYVLTDAGFALRSVLEAMSDWGERWTDSETPEEDMDPMTSVCMLRARCDGRALPDRRVVVEITTNSPKHSRSWLVLENGVASLCVDHPGFDVDLIVRTDVPTLYAIWRDQLTVKAATSSGRIQIEGDLTLAHALPGWFGAASSDDQRHVVGVISS